tara:strand:- start:2389 stop:2937 length:549 start_codon:yes stop_codon:yes gene_type:complete
MEEDEQKITPEQFAQIREIVEVFNSSNFDYLTLELAGMKLTVGTGAAPVPNPGGTAGSGLGLRPDPKTGEKPAAAVERNTAGTPDLSQTGSESAPAEAPEADDGSVAVVAPTMGTFYSRPDPSSPPFAKVGTSVDADETVGLIEIMKVFNNVNAGISGIVTEVCVADGEAVEFGQVIMRIRP